MSRWAKVALLVLWGLILLFVLSDISEDVRGDPYLVQAVPWDFIFGGVLSAAIITIDFALRLTRKR